MSRPALVIHGGAGSQADTARLREAERRLRRICEYGYRVLRRSGALAAVVDAVSRLEDDPMFNAGTGSVAQRDGRVRMSASVMDGESSRFGGVLNIERVRNPVRAARALLGRSDRILAGPEASRFARRLGLAAGPAVAWRAIRPQGPGTVGAVAVDRAGRLAAATSTGGKRRASAGRVSDSGMPVGNWAGDNVAVSCTGLGEDIVEAALAVRIAERARDGRSPAVVLRSMLRELRRKRLAAIAVDRFGRLAWGGTLPVLLGVWRTPTGSGITW
ncbi:MAG TPA: isoaspartyl peptidase/L-asparaginase [bacterium]